MKIRLLVMILMIVVCIGAVMPAGVSAEPTPSWVQVNEDGFGDPQNTQVPALAVYNGYLYCGVWRMDIVTEELSAQIWRSPDGASWEKVFDQPVNGVSVLLPTKGYLYAASWGPNGKMWRSRDGLNWEDISSGLAATSLDAARLANYKNKIYVSSYASGADVWVSSDGREWDPFITPDTGDPNVSSATSHAIFKGYLYWAGDDWVDGGRIWKTDGTTIEIMTTDGFGHKLGAMSSLAAFGKYLYAGGWWDNSIRVWRTGDGNIWRQVHELPFIWGAITALEAFEGELFLVAEDWETGLEVWKTSDGENWTQVGFDGFGDPNNVWSHWDNGTVVFRNNLYIAATNYSTGGEVWKYCPAGCP
jgi:hypothetical protein